MWVCVKWVSKYIDMQTACCYCTINYPEERSASAHQLQFLHILTESSFLFPLIVAIWMGEKRCLAVVFIFIFLVISDTDHCFHVLICYSYIFFGKLFRSSAHFWLRFLVLYCRCLLYVLNFKLLSNTWYMYFLPFCGLSFSLCW